MSLLGKSLAAMVVAVAGVSVANGAGTANAAGGEYGSIATGPYTLAHAVGPTQAAADRAALAACGGVVCTVQLRLKGDCGAVAEFDENGLWGRVPAYYYGTGETAAEARRMALSQAPPVTPFGTAMSLAFGSSVISPAFIRDTVCTANAG
ncbi:DUF4189 domain-containing protein [Nocardia macrotermitis]|uniref:DUF4189 domain-containing protein n=1 Tax=Nocardia macrotermitis TaxID=2585198 RepID=A0A7K0CXI7_9NOCA|nr:DUF4189 domain-containing protein [Nocardia macrotermitis]MQY18138.1 hypothetical protein [Nocardia macrotermitis]